VDEVRLKQREAEKLKEVAPPPIPPPPDRTIGEGGTQLGMPRLTNGTQPILIPPAGTHGVVFRDSGERHASGGSRSESHSAQSLPREYFCKPPKHDFLKFDGTDTSPTYR
jgi:hypothetical protein